jgi:chromatin segregation and condensation protein Rec8/ScpA/Scc1 (kleisin family)
MILHQDQFRVSLEAFDGPLDLLLYLVRRTEVDIQDIEIAKVTDEYLAVLHHATTVDIDMAGEFLVMAATLIEIKSRSLVPAEQQCEDDAAESASDDKIACISTDTNCRRGTRSEKNSVCTQIQSSGSSSSHRSGRRTLP